jgi:four helix bundle protein
MARIEHFEDLQVWQSARELSKLVFASTLNDNLSKDYSLKDQMNRSAGSIMDNIAEGFDRGGKKELIQFLYIAKGSAAELRSQLYRALDRKYLAEVDFENITIKTKEVGKQLSGFIKYLKSSELRGSKYVKEPHADYLNA